MLVVLARGDPQVCPFSHFSGWIGPEREPPHLAANRWALGVGLSKCGDARRAHRTGVSRSQKYAADSAFPRLGRSPLEQSSQVHRLRLFDEQAGHGKGTIAGMSLDLGRSTGQGTTWSIGAGWVDCTVSQQSSARSSA